MRPPLLNGLPPEELVALLRRSHGTTARGGDRLMAGEHDALAVVLRGFAAARTVTAAGEQRISAVHGRGDAYGLPTVFGHPNESAELVAIGRAEALVVPGPAVRDLVDRVPVAARTCLSILASELEDLHHEQAIFVGSAAAFRVERRLLTLADRFGERDGGRVLVPLQLTQEALASWAQTSRESTAKVLHDLRRAGLVTTGRRQIVVEDLAGLRRRHEGGVDVTVAELLRSVR